MNDNKRKNEFIYIITKKYFQNNIYYFYFIDFQKNINCLISANFFNQKQQPHIINAMNQYLNSMSSKTWFNHIIYTKNNPKFQRYATCLTLLSRKLHTRISDRRHGQRLTPFRKTDLCFLVFENWGRSIFAITLFWRDIIS